MSEPTKYRKRSTAVEARLLTRSNGPEIAAWCGGESFDVAMMPGVTHHISVPTIEGPMGAAPGDFIVKDVRGRFYPMDPEWFARTYEEVTDHE